MMLLRTLSEETIPRGARVIVRADFDVAIRHGRVEDETRIRAHDSLFRMLIRRKARIRIVAHLGRPDGREKRFSLDPISRILSERIDRTVRMVRDPFAVHTLKRYNDASDILLFENIRFWKGEEADDPVFARSIARWGDHYINEAFASCHRTHASVVALARMLPAYAGPHLLREVTVLDKIMTRPKRPVAALLGGAKIETKLPLIRRFLKDADYVMIGGALANTALALAGKPVGKSRIDTGVSENVRMFRNKKLLLPSDVVVTASLATGAASRVSSVEDVRPNEYIVDIGPDTSKDFSSHVRTARTVVWNGPLGLAEIKAYSAGTGALARAIKNSGSFSVIGGGDTIAALKRLGIHKGFDHMSTGGGAMLEFLSGRKLPALEVLRQ